MPPLRIELVYDRTCPNVDRARAMIRRALIDVGLVADCTEWDRADSRTPSELRGFGSPTVLVNRRDVSGSDDARAEANSCRVYRDDDGCVCGAPSAKEIARAIRDSQSLETPIPR